MADSFEVEKWLQKANDDYQFSASILPETNFYSQVCFFFQQSAEKYLKAYIIKKQLDFKKMHDLIRLLEICQKKDSSFQEIFDDCNLLNAFYVDTRYPVHWPSLVSMEEALRAKDAAFRVKEFIEVILKEEKLNGKTDS